MKPLEVIILGAYGRGKLYGDYALRHPDEMKVVAVAELNPLRRELFCDKFGVDKSNAYSTWEDILAKPKFADAVIISLPDFLHYVPCMKAIELGYDILLEKPMAQTPEECRKITQAAREKGTIVGVTFVLRYSGYFMLMKRLLDENVIGEVVSLQHAEPLLYQHFIMSYVRGSWRSSKRSTPFILAKSSHDLDILNWVLGKKCTRVSAMGGLKYFKAENAPKGSGERCLQCSCEPTCIFSAKKMHIEDKHFQNLIFDLSKDSSKWDGEILQQLETSEFGRCVYKCDNDQPDSYSMSMEYEGGIIATFTADALTSYSGRRTKIFGTRGDMVGDMETLTVTDFFTGKRTEYDTRAIDAENYRNAGHGGGDEGLIENWIKAVQLRDQSLTISPESALPSHLMGFAAEDSRLNSKIITL